MNMPKLAIVLNFRKKGNKGGQRDNRARHVTPTLTSAAFLHTNTNPFLGWEKAKGKCNTKVNLLYDNPK